MEADPNIGGGIYGSCLNMAITRFQPELALYLLKEGADPNRKDVNGNTPLHLLFSSYSKMVEKAGDLAKVVLEYRADPNIKNYDLWAPIHLMIRGGHVEGLDWIMNHNSRCKKKMPQSNL